MKFFIGFIYIIFFSLLEHIQAQSNALTQLSGDYEYFQKAKIGLRAVYGWQFKEVEEIENHFIEKYPQHPTGYFIKSMRIYWQHYPFNEESKAYEEHMHLIEKAYKKADKLSEEDEQNKDAVLFKLMAKSVMIRNYDNYNKTLKAVGAAKDIYKLMMQAIEMKENYLEFYFPSGIYNYYREYYPKAHPVYKPFVIFFKSGDKALGINELNQAVKKAIFTYPEALGYLAKIYFYYEEEQSKGLELFAKLVRSYPNNTYFRLNYIEALVEAENFSLLKKQLDKSSENSAYYKMGVATFNGIYQQKVKKNQYKAKHFFDEALALEENTYGFGKRYYFYIYKGLADYWQSYGNKEKEAYYRKRARKARDD